MFRIDKISINNYKNLINTEIDLEDLNVIVGPNNSGKSNFLELIPFLKFIISGPKDLVAFRLKSSGVIPPFGIISPIRKNQESHSIDILIRFSNQLTDHLFEYSLELDWYIPPTGLREYRMKSESLNFKPKSKPGPVTKLFKRKGLEISYNKAINHKLPKLIDHYSSGIRIIEILPELELPDFFREGINGLKSILQTPIFYLSNFELKKLDDSTRVKEAGIRTISFDLNKEIASLRETSNWKIFQEALEQILSIDKIRLQSKEQIEKGTDFIVSFEQFGLIKDLNTLPLSDGTVLVIALLVKVLSPQQTLFLIEEPENSLHPKIMNDLIGLFRAVASQNQFIITTHSSSLLNIIHPREVFVARLNSSGNSKIEPVKNIKELQRKINKGYISFGDTLIYNIDEKDENTITVFE